MSYAIVSSGKLLRAFFFMKKCSKCNEIKEYNKFNKRKANRDGFDGICKVCHGIYARAKDRRLLPIRKLDEDWMQKRREHAIRNQQRAMNKYPEKTIARNAKAGRKAKKGNELHHWSYNVQHHKDMIEMPVLEHRKLHRYMIYDQGYMMYRSVEGVLLDTKQAHMDYYHTLANKP